MARVMADSAYGPMLPLNENGKVPLKLFEHYENIFGAYYGNDIIINDVTIATALEDAVGLIEVAEYLGSTAVVAKSIDIALFKQGQVLFRSIASKPDAWVDLAYRIKSELIFKESVIHLVGQWNGLGDEIKQHMPTEVRRVCEKHHEQLRERCKLVEMKVAAIYPSGIERTEPSQIRRESYANDVMIWISLSFFRHWFAQAIIAGRGYLGRDGGYALYKQLAAGGDKYMNKLIMNGFHARFAMTKKGQNVIENHLLEIKECIRQCVAQSGIMETDSQLDTHKYEPTYLTSVKIEKGDYPWIGDTKTARVVSKRVRDAEETDEEEMEVELDSDPDYEDLSGPTKRMRGV